MSSCKKYPLSLDDFNRVSTPGRLLHCDTNSIFPVEGSTRDSKPPLHPFGLRPYIASVANSQLIPAYSLTSAIENSHTALPVGCPDRKPPPGGIQYRADANLLLCGNGEPLMPDSFYLKHLIHPAISIEPDGGWSLPEIPTVQRLEQTCFYLDFLDAHFGHTLVDTAARLWALAEFDPELQAEFSFVAFPRRGIKDSPEDWPEWLLQLLGSYGVDPGRIILLDRPTEVDRLLVPRRITPYRHRGGLHYNKLMKRAGDNLLGSKARSDRPDRKLFLTRSRMLRRPQGSKCNQRLEALFESAGFDILHPQELGLDEQIRLVRSASHIAGCTGSQLHLIAFANQADLNVLRISPGFFCPAIDHNIAIPVGYRVQDFVVQREIEPNQAPDAMPWSLEEEDLLKLELHLKHWLAYSTH